MTCREAIETIRYHEGVQWNHNDKYCVEAINSALDALEKQIPKKIVHTKTNKDVCPVCGINTPIPRNLGMWEIYCPDCGQKIDWSDA